MMDAIKKFIRRELTGWKCWEIFWLAASCSIITGLSIYWNDSLMGIISSTAGVAYVVCTGKGKLLAYAFGLVNSILYAMIAYQAALYGETMLNAFYYVPMQFIGFHIWKKHINDETGEVEKKRMTWNQRWILTAVICIGTYLYGLLLLHMEDAMPFVDSFTTVSSVAAMVISVKMYAEQWWIWFVVDVLSIYMWWRDFSSGSDNMATLLMWVVYAATAVIMFINWEKEAEKTR